MSEDPHRRADDLDGMTALEFVELMHAEDLKAVESVGTELENIARAVDAVARRLREGGRLHYFGAGTSGLIAAMDAAECPATFGIAPDLVQAHTVTDAGEDGRLSGQAAVREAALGPGDVAVGISASGRTPFVLGALEEATARGAITIALVSNRIADLSRSVDIAIQVETGPEVIAGSTRLKAGTVQKLVLNMLSTAVFTRLGHTRRGRMVSIAPNNDKQRERAARILADLSGLSIEDARERLQAAGEDLKAALSE